MTRFRLLLLVASVLTATTVIAQGRSPLDIVTERSRERERADEFAQLERKVDRLESAIEELQEKHRRLETSQMDELQALKSRVEALEGPYGVEPTCPRSSRRAK